MKFKYKPHGTLTGWDFKLWAWTKKNLLELEPTMENDHRINDWLSTLPTGLSSPMLVDSLLVRIFVQGASQKPYNQ